MYHPTSRVLTVLELLQSHEEMSGAEIARRLEVDPRTVRRYIVMLQDMGIPIEGERGRNGAYRLGAGFKLPPLMLTNEEALSLILSLRVAQQTTLTGAPVAVEGALSKIERALPDSLREQIQDILQTLDMVVATPSGVAASPEIVATISSAARHQQRVQLCHQGHDGSITERVVDPYGVVYRVGRWYMVGFCHLRGDIRTFRLDRILSTTLLQETFEPPIDFNLLEHVEKALAATPGIYKVEVLFKTTMEAVQAQVPMAFGQLTEVENGVYLTAFVQNLSWAAGFLAGLTLPLEIRQPEALRAEMACLIERVKAF